jgi:hypothetical protein
VTVREKETAAPARRSFHNAVRESRGDAKRLRKAADRLERMKREGGHDADGVLATAVIKLHDLARIAEGR